MANKPLAASDLLPLQEYDLVVVSYSGGKDSLACILSLLEKGVPREKMELWHQDVDGGQEDGLMDWPCTASYAKITGECLGIRTLFQWKEKGFEGEMLRENSLTKPMMAELPEGGTVRFGGTRGKLSTRRKFPQVSSDLQTRWCSSYLKIDVAAAAMTQYRHLDGKKILFVTGERRQESTARSKYAQTEQHRSSNRMRRVDQCREVLDWSEESVWRIIERWRIRVHPAYFLGWGRVSCLACIFGDPNQWASVRVVDPDRFSKIAQYEKDFGLTIKKGLTVIDQADEGKPFPQTASHETISLAMSRSYPREKFFVPSDEDWPLPPGAYKRCSGPT